MTRQNLRQAMQPPTQGEPQAGAMQAPATHKNVATMLADPKMQEQIRAALPKHLTAERFARIVLTEARKVPKLMQCDHMSLMGAVMQAAQLGLEVGAALGHCYLIPFERRFKDGNQWRTVTDAQLIIGYRGMLDLARRSGQIESIEARAIYEKDKFDIALGLESDLKHFPAWHEKDRGAPMFFYAVAKFRDGGRQFDVMSVNEIDAIRDASQGYKAAVANAEKYGKDRVDSPWVTHYDEMAKKTVIRRLFKYLPVSIEIQRAVGLDELGDMGKQHNAFVIDGDYKTLPEGDGNELEGNDGAKGIDMAQMIHDAMAGASTVDELNEAWELGGPEFKHPPELATFYNDKLKEFQG